MLSPDWLIVYIYVLGPRDILSLLSWLSSRESYQFLDYFNYLLDYIKYQQLISCNFVASSYETHAHSISIYTESALLYLLIFAVW